MKMPEKCFEQFLEEILELQNQGFPILNPYEAAEKRWKEYLQSLEMEN